MGDPAAGPERRPRPRARATLTRRAPRSLTIRADGRRLTPDRWPSTSSALRAVRRSPGAASTRPLTVTESPRLLARPARAARTSGRRRRGRRGPGSRPGVVEAVVPEGFDVDVPDHPAPRLGLLLVEDRPQRRLPRPAATRSPAPPRTAAPARSCGRSGTGSTPSPRSAPRGWRRTRRPAGGFGPEPPGVPLHADGGEAQVGALQPLSKHRRLARPCHLVDVGSGAEDGLVRRVRLGHDGPRGSQCREERLPRVFRHRPEVQVGGQSSMQRGLERTAGEENRPEQPQGRISFSHPPASARTRSSRSTAGLQETPERGDERPPGVALDLPSWSPASWRRWARSSVSRRTSASRAAATSTPAGVASAMLTRRRRGAPHSPRARGRGVVRGPRGAPRR